MNTVIKSLAHVDAKKAKNILQDHTIRLLRQVEPPRATLRFVEFDEEMISLCGLEDTPEASSYCGTYFACKDFFDATALYRNTIGKYLIKREYQIYNRLKGIKGIPQRVLCPRKDILCVEFLQGRDIKYIERGQLPHCALDQLRTLLDAMHSRGVVHFDIGHDSYCEYGRETNIIWGDDEQIYLLDFAGSLTIEAHNDLYKLLNARNDTELTKTMHRFFPEKPPYPRELLKDLFRVLEIHDQMAITKMKRKFFPEEPIDARDVMPDWGLALIKKLRKY